MAVKRYIELKFDKNIFNESYLINDILIKNDFGWLIDAEIENARIELVKDSGDKVTLIWNAGTWISGTWEYGVFRDGTWRSGTWNNGVWYGGVWKQGTFNSGIISGGKFLNGKILSGEIRGGQFFDIEIGENVTKKSSTPEQKTQPQIENRHWDVKKKKPMLDIVSLKKKFDELEDKSRFSKMMKFSEFSKKH